MRNNFQLFQIILLIANGEFLGYRCLMVYWCPSLLWPTWDLKVCDFLKGRSARTGT